MTLSFTDFELEMVNSNCSHDSVEVLDGDNYQAPSVGKDKICSLRNCQSHTLVVIGYHLYVCLYIIIRSRFWHFITFCLVFQKILVQLWLVITSNLFPGRYCGNELPHPVTSFSNALVVNFISDASVGRKGFRATYMASTSG